MRTTRPSAVAPQGGRTTTPDEHQATYQSLVGLEPTVMSEVVASHGQDPELLTFVRKARGQEAHKGGALIMPGDDQDVCITSWLAGATDTIACAQRGQRARVPAGRARMRPPRPPAPALARELSRVRARVGGERPRGAGAA